LPDAHVATILRASKARFDALSLDSGIAHATIFKNHRVEAGTAVAHSHCQLITAPVISSQVANRLQAALSHYHQFGQCIFCTVLREEFDDQTRIVMATEHFVALEPFASATPFCTHIYPLRHMANFGEIRGDEINDLARILRGVLAKLYFGLENPDFSYIIRTAPVGKAEIQYYHWYLSISPRLSGAGFDLGSGTLINTVWPEQAAEFLREVRVEQAIPA
jgi:UDPglucose--hexose-1-phosphate uridylyltransferase